jgi:restriction system protein
MDRTRDLILMKAYYRVMLGRGSAHAAEAFAGSFVGTDFGIEMDLSSQLSEELREFNKTFIPLFIKMNPEKTKIGAGLAMAALWTVSKGIKVGDIVLSPDGQGRYRVAEVIGDYQYKPGQPLFHRRPVRWFDRTIDRSAMSDPLQRSTGSIGTVSNITKHATELENLIGGLPAAPSIVAMNPEIENPAAFALEEHLEDFLMKNWHHTELGKEYDIYEEDGELVGKQYQTETAGRIDMLAISKDKRRLLVVELKKGRPNDKVVGQVLRYMGYVKEDLTETGQEVYGVIIAPEDDQQLQRALMFVPNVEFFRYQISFRLVKGQN